MAAPDIQMVALASASGIGAAVAGYSLWQVIEDIQRSRRHRRSLIPKDAAAKNPLNGSVNDFVIGYMEALSTEGAARQPKSKAQPLTSRADGFPEESRIRLAGLDGKISHQGYRECCIRLAVALGAMGLAIGLLFSPMLALILCALGAFAGFRAPDRSLRSCMKIRARETERHLPEMLNVIALGMRSGLSFESSLTLYSKHFDTSLSRELESAQRQWTSGLVRRDDALRKVAGTYDSVVFGRVVETIIRSIRYGSSMVKSLESDAEEARSAYQAEREERVAKAPVKMMIPTGILILPAMLILVLGPVLLELMEGGF